LVGIDRFGNKYFENMEEELPRMLRILRRFEGKS
jgi:hypothetical protein